MPRPPASRKAFTLIEVMMAATVLVVSFSAIIEAVTMGAAMIDTARKQQIAQQIMEGEINGLRQRRWGGSVPVPGDIYYPDTNATATIVIDSTGNAQGLSGDDNNMLQFVLTNFTKTPSDDNTTLLNAAKGFTLSRSIENVTPTFRKITFIVTWPGRSGRMHTQSIVSYFGQNGLHLSYQK